ncbi:MAG: phosphoribosylanthranilate isomerase [Deltaproteobacteria bacterium]|nr:phosphoribosylanthranilate isomerase [Deltaproteobacteria bacterium]
MTMRIKICGITTRDDACNALAHGADYIGIIVDIAGSRRSVTLAEAARISAGIGPVVLLMEAPAAAIAAALCRVQPHAVQLIGAYAPDDIRQLKQSVGTPVWMTVNVPPAGRTAAVDLERSIERLHASGLDAIVLDTLLAGHKGGTGRTCDWDAAAAIVRSAALPVWLAGGLTPDNVARAAAAVRPFGVDVSSGVESTPGRKDPDKVARFINHACSAAGPAD